MTVSNFRVLLSSALIVCSALGTAQAGKLYKWVDANGNVHYSDSVPPEAVDQARKELSDSGLVVKETERAPTPEERAAMEKKKAEEAVLAAKQAEIERQEAIMMAAYTSEADIERARDQKIEMIDRQIESYEASLKSLQSSLTQLNARAAENQRAGRPVSEALAAQIEESKKNVQKQEAAIKQKRIDRAGVSGEFDAELKRYREMVARMNR
jgi:Domain of unknown function (DUF4124)